MSVMDERSKERLRLALRLLFANEEELWLSDHDLSLLDYNHPPPSWMILEKAQRILFDVLVHILEKLDA